ncbi:hypothetical protein DEDE109153_08325 [Deinococcus deserti]|uniref:Uncharacterized protein n=1 Tax=Deinococcus deserti (strain DSM 17065 / CIP 109153 / LMG 22923 / VCD115) TaxID=546414 RepID=X5HNB3_DEIDV|nr:hypothetical protein [Deinococcus deserti]AHX26577.1 hypothetical protein Deide_3p01977 [Deinococcus deserti VCD115]
MPSFSYLLKVGEASLEKVLRHIVQDNYPEAAEDELYVARKALGKTAHEVLVPYHQASRIYGIHRQRGS